jgi:hypothetical protein
MYVCRGDSCSRVHPVAVSGAGSFNNVSIKLMKQYFQENRRPPNFLFFNKCPCHKLYSALRVWYAS